MLNDPVLVSVISFSLPKPITLLVSSSNKTPSYSTEIRHNFRPPPWQATSGGGSFGPSSRAPSGSVICPLRGVIETELMALLSPPWLGDPCGLLLLFVKHW